MIFAESAVVSEDVSESTTLIGPPFAELYRTKLSDLSFNSRIKMIVFFPTIIDPAIGVMADKITCKRSEPSVFIQANIPYAEWLLGDAAKRVVLYVDALVKGISLIRDSAIVKSERDLLISLARETQQEMEMRVAH